MLRTLTLTIVGAAALVGIFATSASAGENTPAAGAKADARSNPFFTQSPLPFQAPPFDKIHDDDFKPALEEGIRLQRLEVEKIADNPAPATFENTLVALERSGQLLTRVNLVFNGLSSANTDPTLQKLQEEMAPKLAALQDAIFLNPKLFERVEAIYETRATLKLDPESLRLVEFYRQQFVHAGAKLSDADKATLKQLNERDAALSAKFVNQLLAGDEGGRAGRGRQGRAGRVRAGRARRGGAGGEGPRPRRQVADPAAEHDAAAGAVVADRPRHAREALPGVVDCAPSAATPTTPAPRSPSWPMLRAEKAKLLGFPSYAAWRLEDQMAKTPAAVEEFLGKLVPPATANARGEAARIQELIDRQHGGFTLEPWDWEFYAEQVRKAKYDLDEAQLKPYFELNRVLTDGVFYAAHELYGITFKERHDIPVYHPDVRVFEVFDKDGSPLALFYCDYFKRDNKSGGAWMDIFVGQSKLLGTKPVVYNVANFTKPAPGQPALLSCDDVTTMFHEFGHALHGMFADEQYPTLSGTNVARDFVEFPSQINEHWALYPTVLAHYAIHYADRQADAAGAGGQDQEGRHVQPGLRPDRDPGGVRARHAVAHAPRRRASPGRGPVRGRGAEEDRRRPAAGAAALPLQLLPAHLEQRLRRRLLRLSLGGDARRRRLRLVRRERRPDPRQRRPLPRHDPVARQHGGPRQDVPRLPGP